MSGSQDNEVKTPEAGKRDVAHAPAKAGIAFIPIIGGPTAELALVIAPTLEKRRVDKRDCRTTV